MEIMENSEECNEKERLKMRIAVLEESVKSCELECKASGETMMRLVAELDQERRKAASKAAALESLKMELDGQAVGRRNVETEKETLSERLQASRRVIEAARRESRCLEKQVEELQKKTQAAEVKLQVFLGKVASLLQGESDSVVLSRESDILEKLDNLCNKTVSEMKMRLSSVTEELKEQTGLQHSTLQRAQLAEQQVQDLRERLQGLETELLTTDMHHDRLKHSKQHYEEFLELLSGKMKVEDIAADVGFDMRLKVILSRTDQLVKQEAAALMESKSLTYSLQRKVKSQKDQLESRDLHIQLLRKKVSELEEEKRSRSASAVERDDARVEARRLQKKLERLQSQLRDTKLSNTELKTQLSHTNELKSKVTEQSQTMKKQKEKLDQLADMKAKVEKKLNTVTSDLQSHDKKAREDQELLSTLRQSLSQLSERQKELMDFRILVSQMLGLDSTGLAHHEIITSLETLLHSHHYCCHLHHHHVKVPGHCSTLHLLQTQDLPDSHASLEVSTTRSACSRDAVPPEDT